jgi:hypothetical protein
MLLLLLKLGRMLLLLVGLLLRGIEVAEDVRFRLDGCNEDGGGAAAIAVEALRDRCLRLPRCAFLLSPPPACLLLLLVTSIVSLESGERNNMEELIMAAAMRRKDLIVLLLFRSSLPLVAIRESRSFCIARLVMIDPSSYSFLKVLLKGTTPNLV